MTAPLARPDVERLAVLRTRVANALEYCLDSIPVDPEDIDDLLAYCRAVEGERDLWMRQAFRESAAKAQPAPTDAAIGTHLKRNTRWASDKMLEGEWTCIPTEDFTRAYAALNSSDAAAVERVARALARFGRNDPTIEATIERVERTWRRYIPEAEAALRAARAAP